METIHQDDTKLDIIHHYAFLFHLQLFYFPIDNKIFQDNYTNQLLILVEFSLQTELF